MDRIIIKANLFLQEPNLIPLIRWLFPECPVHVVPPEYTVTPEPEDNPSAVEMEAAQGA
jgi:hypothetical protein